jgi:hypothetical protein
MEVVEQSVFFQCNTMYIVLRQNVGNIFDMFEGKLTNPGK